jgi:hypothetical protein
MVQLKRRSNAHKFQHLSRDMFNFTEILYEPEAAHVISFQPISRFLEKTTGAAN